MVVEKLVIDMIARGITRVRSTVDAEAEWKSLTLVSMVLSAPLSKLPEVYLAPVGP